MHACAINLGRRPTFYEHADHSLLEAHLLDFSDDLYGERGRVRFVAFLRSERKFDGIDALVAQLKRDIDAARQALHVDGSDPEARRGRASDAVRPVGTGLRPRRRARSPCPRRRTRPGEELLVVACPRSPASS